MSETRKQTINDLLSFKTEKVWRQSDDESRRGSIRWDKNNTFTENKIKRVTGQTSEQPLKEDKSTKRWGNISEMFSLVSLKLSSKYIYLFF